MILSLIGKEVQNEEAPILHMTLVGRISKEAGQ